MDSENLITWNLPNFISIALMVIVLWTLAGVAGHFLFRAPAQQQQAQQQGGG